MATVAEFAVPAEMFPLGSIFDELPDVTIELERIVPTNHALFPYFWVRGADAERIEDAIEDHPALESVELVDEVGARGLFRAEWNEGVDGIITAIGQVPVTIISATGNQDEWVFEFRTEDAEAISAFQQYCHDHGIDATLVRLHALPEMHAGGEHDLTAQQHEALVLAFNEGYYDDPRRTTLEELASQLGITRTSFAARLRRGYRNLLASTITSSDIAH